MENKNDNEIPAVTITSENMKELQDNGKNIMSGNIQAEIDAGKVEAPREPWQDRVARAVIDFILSIPHIGKSKVPIKRYKYIKELPETHEFFCCNSPTFMSGYIWDIKLLKVAVCLSCEHVEAFFGYFGDLVLFLGNIFNNSGNFAIKYYKRDPDVCVCGSMLSYVRSVTGAVYKECTDDPKCPFHYNPDIYRQED